uniref:distal membrane-arm assembly complex protein 2 n=1 Tax=Vespula vulgaris TaxID=7454 RepID=UPI00223AA192|nr:distal membrane-arm assembly complex protein 2 [Vespula vulgaris]
MLLLHFVNKLIFDELTKTSHVVRVKNLQYFSTGNKLMERIPRNIKDCSRFIVHRNRISSEDKEPKAVSDTSFSWFKAEAPPPQTFSIGNIKSWWEYNKRLLFAKQQEFNFKRASTLGSNIAAAYFVIEWSGKVKFKNSNWLEATKDKPVRLPNSYKPNYIIIGIDASNTLICYEGLKNMNSLHYLKWLSFKGCEYIDDWCIDKISAQYPSLEYLDISDCKNVTERALEAIYKLYNLKTLIVTNHQKSATFELTCLMLEECNTNLQCKIFNSRYSNNKSQEKNK